MSGQDNAIDKTLDSLDKIIRVRSGGISPVEIIALLLLGRSDINTTKFGVHDRCTGLVRGTFVDTWDWLEEDAAAASFGGDDAFKSGAGLLNLRTIRVVMECGQIGEIVLPATVIVDTSGIIEVLSSG